MSRNRSVLGLGGPLADHDVGAYKLLAATTAASPRRAQRPPGAQAGRQLAAQCPPPLDVQRLVNRLVRDPHRFIVGILDPEPMGDLLRAPRCHPMSVLAAAMTSTTPGAHVWARHGRPRPQPSLCLRGGPARSSSADRSRPAWLFSGAWHVGRCATAQSTPDTPDRRSESPRCDVALARQSTGLSGADGQCHAPRRPALAGSRSRPAPQRTGSEPNRGAKLIGGIPPPSRNQRPPTGGEHATGHSGILTRQPPRDRLPEPLLLRTPRCRRPTRRTYRRPTRPV